MRRCEAREILKTILENLKPTYYIAILSRENPFSCFFLSQNGNNFEEPTLEGTRKEFSLFLIAQTEVIHLLLALKKSTTLISVQEELVNTEFDNYKKWSTELIATALAKLANVHTSKTSRCTSITGHWQNSPVTKLATFKTGQIGYCTCRTGQWQTQMLIKPSTGKHATSNSCTVF